MPPEVIESSQLARWIHVGSEAGEQVSRLVGEWIVKVGQAKVGQMR